MNIDTFTFGNTVICQTYHLIVNCFAVEQDIIMENQHILCHLITTAV